MDAVRAEVMSAQTACQGTLEPSLVTEQQGSSVAARREQPAPVQQTSLEVPQYEPSVLKRPNSDGVVTDSIYFYPVGRAVQAAGLQNRPDESGMQFQHGIPKIR